MTQPGPASPPSRPSLRTVPIPVFVLVGLTVVALVLTAVAIVHVGPTALRPGQASGPGGGQGPGSGPGVGATLPPSAGLGVLGGALVAQGYSCTLELPDPLISGCHSLVDGRARSLRWQGPGGQPTELVGYVTSDSTDHPVAAELEGMLAGLSESGVWTADDLAAVRAESDDLTEGQQADVDTSWGRVRLDAGDGTVSVAGTRTGATAQPVTAKTFPTPLDDLEPVVTPLGFECQRPPTAPDTAISCADRDGSYVTMSGARGQVQLLNGSFEGDAARSAFVRVVEAAAPADAALLSGLVEEGAATRGAFSRVGNGWVVLCLRYASVICSVKGVSWAG